MKTLADIVQGRIPPKETWKKLPKHIRRWLQPIRKKKVAKAFELWVKDMGYESHMESATLRTYMFEAFAAGWGMRARIAQKEMGKPQKDALSLIRQCKAHVAMQETLGKHEQDRIDAKRILPKLEYYLRKYE